MLLRRFSEHVKDQNWFAVILDFFIVVLGVVVAFQLQTWGQDRATAARADRSLHLLYEESESIVLEWAREVDSNDRLLEIQDAAVAALSRGDMGDMDEERFDEAIFRMAHYPTISPPRRVYDTLSNAGLLSDIDAPGAMDAVSIYYETLQFIQGQIVFFRPDPLERQDFRLGEGVNSSYDNTQLIRIRLDIDFEALAADPLYLNTVSNNLRNRLVFQGYRRNALLNAIAMCEALAEAEGATCAAAIEAEEHTNLPEWQTRNIPDEVISE